MSGTSGAGATTAPTSQIALGADIVSELYGLNGTGLKIGIISDSYNNLGGAAQDIANGALPDNVTVVRDNAGPTGSDEARAMTELVYKIAPGASLYVASGGHTVATCAAAVNALVDSGCNIIIDDLGFGNQEGFFQVGTTLDLAIMNAVSLGVDYFSAASNDGTFYYQGTFAPTTTIIPKISPSPVIATSFGDGQISQQITIPAESQFSSGELNLAFQWAQPFASIGSQGHSAQNSMAVYLLDAQGNIVSQSSVNQVGGDPTQSISYTNTSGSSQVYSLVVVQNGGTVPAGEIFKYILLDGNAATSSSWQNTGGSGNIFGHELVSDQNSVGAVNWSQTPAYGVSPPVPESFSGVGPGQILFDQNGNPLAQPEDPGVPMFAAPDGSATPVPGFSAFTGTSAAAPDAGAVAALLLQANPLLTTAQVTEILAQSAIPTGSTIANSGAGLIQARAAVEIGVGYGGVYWTQAGGGAWATPSAWSTGLLPTSEQAVLLDDNYGAITTSYEVTLDTGTALAASLAVASPGSIAVTLLLNGGALDVANTGTTDITGNDFLVSNGGTLLMTSGSMNTAGTLNVNAGFVSLVGGGATAGAFAQNAGTTDIGVGDGASQSATLELLSTNKGSITFGLNGGVVEVGDAGALSFASGSLVGGTLIVDQDGVLSSSGSIAAFGSVAITDSGSITAAGLALSGAATLTTTGNLQVTSLAVGTGATTTATATINGGNVTVGTTQGTPSNTLTVNSGAVLSMTAGTLNNTGFMNVNGGTVSISGGTLTETGTMFVVKSTSSGAISNGLVIVQGTGTVAAQATGVDASTLLVRSGGTFDAGSTLSVEDGALVGVRGRLTAGTGEIEANLTVATGGTFSVGETLQVLSGGTIADGGLIQDNGALMGDNTHVIITIESTGTLSVGGTTSGAGIAFSGDGGRLLLTASDQSTLQTGYTSIITGLNQSGTGVDFTSLNYAAGDQVTVTGSTLSVTDGESLLATLQVDPTVNYNLVVANDGSGHLLVETAPCFLTGSRICTPQGQIEVERLEVGDQVITLDGSIRPIRWIGRRHLDPRRHSRPADVMPIRIRRHAFGKNLPCRDLMLSPDHAVFIDGMLVPVKYLVNGRTITEHNVNRPITYFHIELDRHDILLAEGLTVESYLETGCRAGFENTDRPMMLHPAFRDWSWEGQGCAPLIITGPSLQAARNDLERQADKLDSRKLARSCAAGGGKRQAGARS